jgi:hypothetical protein
MLCALQGSVSTEHLSFNRCGVPWFGETARIRFVDESAERLVAAPERMIILSSRGN